MKKVGRGSGEGWPTGRATVALVAGWSLALLLPSYTADEAVELADSSIPSERFYTASVWTGTDLLTFGGETRNGTRLKEILKFTPSVGGNATVVDNLTKGVHSMSAIWDGSLAFIFGGDDEDNNGTRIVAYNPSNGTDWVVAHFATGRGFTSAVWTGQYAYIFGGVAQGGSNFLGEVVRFNTVTFAVDTVVPDNSTVARSATSAVWDGEHAYIFAGRGCDTPNGNCNDTVRYTPSNDSIKIMGPKFPTPRAGTAAAWDGLAAYVFGIEVTAGTTEIWRYRPSTDNLSLMSASLPSPRAWTNAVWNGTYAYVLTGKDAEAPWPTSIVRYSLTPGKPIDMLLDSGNGGPVEINSTWLPPANDTYTHPITNYTLYRNVAGLAANKVIKLGNVTSHTDNDDLTELVTYCYNVTATNARGEGPPFPGLLGPPRCAVAW